VAVILGCPRYSEETDEYYNAAILIDEQGEVAGEHYKINVLPGSEGWSSSGVDIKPIVWNGCKIGLLVCSDAYTENIAGELARQGANVAISPAAWGPGFHGPDGEWEQRSKETGLCLFVCNRTGVEKNMIYSGSSSVVVAGGRRVIDYSNEQPAILSVDVRSSDWLPLSEGFNILEVYET
jgi:predicted amidohydrolase